MKRILRERNGTGGIERAERVFLGRIQTAAAAVALLFDSILGLLLFFFLVVVCRCAFEEKEESIGLWVGTG